MNPITEIINLLTGLQPTTSKDTSPADGATAPFLQAIDQLVAAEDRATKANIQAAIEKSKVSEEKSLQQRQKTALLTSQMDQTQIALSSLEGSQPSAANVQNANQLIDFKRQEIVYWQSRVEQADSPSGEADSSSRRGPTAPSRGIEALQKRITQRKKSTKPSLHSP